MAKLFKWDIYLISAKILNAAKKITFAKILILMKYSIFFFGILLFFSCQPSSSDGSDSSGKEPLIIPEKSPVPIATDIPEVLKDLLRKTLRTEIAFTFPETINGLQAKKSYSFDLEENNGRPTWVIKEKYHDMSDKLYAGAEYMLLWDVVEASSIKIENSTDREKTALSIRPTTGNTFLYRPYSNDPDVAVNQITIGWFDRTQDDALLRAYTYMRMLAENMGKYNAD